MGVRVPPGAPNYMKKLIFVLVLLVWMVGIPFCGDTIDSYCIKGKCKYNQKLYIKGVNPTETICEEGDRILKKQCSELMRSLTFRNQYEVIVKKINRGCRAGLKSALKAEVS